MYVRVIATLPFLFSINRLTLSLLRQGPPGVFGLVVEQGRGSDSAGIQYAFVEFDLNRGKTTISSVFLPYDHVLGLQLQYDDTKSRWVLAINGAIHHLQLDIYALAHGSDARWPLLFSMHNFQTDPPTYKLLMTFWQHGDDTPLLFQEPDNMELYDATLRWTQWGSSTQDQPSSQFLTTAYRWAVSLHTHGWVLLTCQCVYDEPQSSPTKAGAGQWRFHSASYTHDGRLFQQMDIPQTFQLVDDRKVASMDLSQWLLPSMTVCPGPPHQTRGWETCIAVLVLRDDPQLLQRLYGRSQSVKHEQQASRGGVYWIDSTGRVLRYAMGITGIQTSLCLCGGWVVGATLQEGAWQCWTWQPATETAHTIKATLPAGIRRVTVEAPEGDVASDWFWCVEEHEHDLRVTRRTREWVSEIEVYWCAGYHLPDWWEGSLLYNIRPHGVLAYQKTLLVLAMNQDKQLQLLQFHP